jgi:hypothetical protein
MTFSRSLILVLTLILVSFIPGCTPKNIEPQKTQLQIREFQTRSYEARDTKQVMKAVLNALQDEGFLIKSADRELGFISASKEVDIEDGTERFFAKLFEGNYARYKKSSQMEASANVSEFGKQTRVRMIFQTKILDNFNAPVNTIQVEDEIFYRDFFAKVDKSLFIEKEKL